MQLVNSALAKVHLGPLSEHLIRKLAHFSEFALEGFLLMLCTACTQSILCAT